jgi:NAD(P)H dehydrogenase (quinone)
MILVTGATGRLGGAVVDQLLERIDAAGIAILARDPARVEDLIGRGVSVCTGDYDDTASLARAMDGVDRVVMVASNQPQRRMQQHTGVIDAAVSADVSVFSFTSRSLTNIESSRNQLMRDYLDPEQLIQRSGLQSLIFDKLTRRDNGPGAQADLSHASTS